MKYYYLTNRDGTTRKGFIPFKDGADYAEAPDWDPNPKIDCGKALHVIDENPVDALSLVVRNNPVAYEVEPIDILPKYGGKYRCRSLKKIRRLSDEEFAQFYLEKGLFGISLAIMNGHIETVKLCFKEKLKPTRTIINYAAKFGYYEVLDLCIKNEFLPTGEGANWAAGCGHTECLKLCIENGIFPDYRGANWADQLGHKECLKICVENGVKPFYFSKRPVPNIKGD